MTDNIISCGLLLNLFLDYFFRQTLGRKIFLGDSSTVAEASTGPRSNCQLSPTFASLARKVCFAEMAVVGLQHGPNNYKDTKPKMSSLLVFNSVFRLEIQSFMLVFPTPLVN